VKQTWGRADQGAVPRRAVGSVIAEVRLAGAGAVGALREVASTVRGGPTRRAPHVAAFRECGTQERARRMVTRSVRSARRTLPRAGPAARGRRRRVSTNAAPNVHTTAIRAHPHMPTRSPLLTRAQTGRNARVSAAIQAR